MIPYCRRLTVDLLRVCRRSAVGRPSGDCRATVGNRHNRNRVQRYNNFLGNQIISKGYFSIRQQEKDWLWIGYGCERDRQGIGYEEAMDVQGIAMDAARDRLWIGYGWAMDAKGIGYEQAMDRLWMRQGIGYEQAMDVQGIGYGCAMDRLWMRKGCSMQIHRLTDSQIHKFTFSQIHTKMCVPLFAIIYII